MRRALLVLAGLFLVVGVTRGDYIIIRINLNPTTAPATPPPGTEPGGEEPGVIPGGPGGIIPGGPGGIMPGGPGGFNLGGPGGIPGGPGGIPGGPGFPRPNPGGMPPGGFGVGGGGVIPGGGQPLPPIPGTPGEEEPGTTPPPPPAPPAKPQWFVAVIEADISANRNGFLLRHKWGQTLLPGDGYRNLAYLQVLTVDGKPTGKPVPSIDKQLEAQKTRLLKDRPLELIDWMLRHWNLPSIDGKFDMQKKLEELLDQLAKGSKLEGNDQAKLQALLKVRDRLNPKNALASPESDLAELQRILQRALPEKSYKITISPHYVLLYGTRDDKLAEQRLKRLEHTYAGFFYWFALQNQPRPEPEKKLLCVLSENADHFGVLHQTFDEVPHAADGFYNPLDNVAVFSPSRVDSAFQEFNAAAGNFERRLNDLEGLDFHKLLRGEKLPAKVEKDLQSDKKVHFDVTFGKMLALAQQAAQEEGEIATITHEGTYQLAMATGLLPRRVNMPEAVRFGLGSLFETPKSKGTFAFAADVTKDGGLPAYWSGISAPSWTYLEFFKGLLAYENKTATLNPKTAQELKVKIDKLDMLKILQDAGFEGAGKADEKEQPFLREKARAEAWALTYFLARARKENGNPYLDSLLGFYEELGRLPRDMELTPKAIERAFARAMDLQKSPGSDELDKAKLEKLHDRWRAFLRAETLEVGAQPLPQPPEEPKPPTLPPGLPMLPGLPGG